VLKKSLAPFAVVVLLGTGSWVQARAFNQESSASTAQSSTANIHVEGCLFTEAGLASGTPVIIPAGSTQSYVLTNTKLIAGSISEEEAAKTIYVLSQGNQDELRSFHTKRVGVVGRAGSGSDRPRLDIVSIREISGGCPTLPGR
jgi:hypothetical protein